ncbi:MAG: polymerase sigma factor AlgU [Phycisphaerales bacterium]|nr:polymerase sigma factor AlgU [Phycisphaerales bacterium]MDB5356573.1 polymerase sigma factor AlgU [Phycisphaerales bacterium]
MANRTAALLEQARPGVRASKQTRSARPAPQAREYRSDERVLSDYLRGDEASFDVLVNRYHGELIRFLMRQLGNHAAAEDVAQETFMRLHRAAGQFEAQRGFRTWLLSIAANAAKDVYRWHARRPACSIHSLREDGAAPFQLQEKTVVPPGERLEQLELRETVRRVVDRMPAHLREILLLSYFGEYSYREIAQTLGIPLGTVKSRLHAAVANFGSRWAATQTR